MKLISVTKEGEKGARVILNTETVPFVNTDSVEIGLVYKNTEIVYPDKALGIAFFKATVLANDATIAHNQKSLDQMACDDLEKIAGFVEIIEKVNALSKRKSDVIESLVINYNTMRSIKLKIKSETATRDQNLLIVEALEKL